jgi:hypothetical protein
MANPSMPGEIPEAMPEGQLRALAGAHSDELDGAI